MRRQQVLVRVPKAGGKWDSVDVLDLDDESFRAFILDRLLKANVIAGLRDEHSGEIVLLKERSPK